MAFETKTDKAKNLIQQGRLVEALRIVKDFRMMPPADRKLFQQTWECFQNPRMYIQMRGAEWIESTKEQGLSRLREWGSV